MISNSDIPVERRFFLSIGNFSSTPRGGKFSKSPLFFFFIYRLIDHTNFKDLAIKKYLIYC